MRGDHTRDALSEEWNIQYLRKAQLSLAYRNSVKCVSNMKSIYYQDIVLVWYWSKTRYVTTPIDSVERVAIGWC